LPRDGTASKIWYFAKWWIGEGVQHRFRDGRCTETILRGILMSRLRSLLVNAFIAGYLCLILVFLVAGREDWPFCIYPMFSTLDRRADFERVEFFTVSQGKEKWVNLRYTYMVTWGFVLPAVLKKKGWPSEDTKHFLGVALDDFRRQSQRENPSAPPPDALRAYSVTYHYPDSGGFQSTIIRKVMLLQYNKGDL
jgi:hypothetical protein